VNFSSGNLTTIAGSYDLTGPTNISGYGVAFDSNITTPSTINLISGNLAGSGNVTMTGLFTWSGGTLGGTGAITASGGINLTTAAAKSLNRTLNNNGVADYTGSNFSFYFGTFNNYGTFNMPGDANISTSAGGLAFNNLAGATFNRTTSSGTAVFDLPFNNSGTVNVQSGTLRFANSYTQTAGSIVLNGGSLSTSSLLSIQGGALKGSGNITGSVTIGAAGAVEIELGGTTPGTGPTNYDQLNITGSATLSGTLKVTLTGGFTPVSGNTFTIMTYLSHSGTFATTNLPLSCGLAWNIAYNTGSAVLSVATSSNRAPAAFSDAYSTNEDTTLNVAASGVMANDTDLDCNSLTITLVSNVSHGTLVLNADGSFAYTPAANYNGSDSFTYKAYDGSLYSNTATVTIAVNAVNDAPAAPTGGAAYSTDENAVLNQAAPGVLGNVTDIDGNPLTAVLVSNVSHGTLVLNANGSFTYTPAAGFTGSDSFTCKANDGTSDSSVFTVTITVNEPNEAPVAPTGGVAYSTSEDAVLNQAAPGVLKNVTDIDGDPLTAVLVSNVSHGTLVLNANGSFTYTPAAGFTGSDSFTCKANDGAADSSVFTVTVEVTQPEPPTISSLDHLKAAPGETIRVVITGTKLGGATEVDFGPGVTVEGLTIDSASQITVDVKVASDAQSGSRDVTVTTPQGVATLTDAFTVKKAPSGGMPVWIWPVAALAVIAAGAGGFFLFFLLPRRKAKKAD